MYFCEQSMQNQNELAIETAIYFLKVPELSNLCELAGHKPAASKQKMIDTLLTKVCGIKSESKTYKKWKQSEIKSIRAKYDETKYILPGAYSNNRTMKERFKKSIGKHFSFTSFGMDWIREQWERNQFPTFEQFELFWQQEYKRRKYSDDFSSAKTLQRVNFFRKMKDKEMNKDELEAAWAKERARQSQFAISAIERLIELQQG